VRPVEGPPPARGDAGAAGRVRGRPPAPRLTRARAGPDPRAVATATAADTSREGGRQAPAACLDEAAQWPAGSAVQRGSPAAGSLWLQDRGGVASGAPPGAGAGTPAGVAPGPGGTGGGGASPARSAAGRSWSSTDQSWR